MIVGGDAVAGHRGPPRSGGDCRRNPNAVASTSGSGRWTRLRQWVRYGATSCVATITSLVVLGGLVATDTLSPGWANIVATAVGTVPSFELNRRWVWGRSGRPSMAAEVGPFAALSFAGLVLSTLLVTLIGRWAASAELNATWRTLAVSAANLAAFGTLWVAQFLILDRVLFARRSTPSDRICAMTSAERASTGRVSMVGR